MAYHPSKKFLASHVPTVLHNFHMWLALCLFRLVDLEVIAIEWTDYIVSASRRYKLI